MDLTYRTDLRTLNDTNFARFEALLDSRFARADLQLERQLNERLGEFGQANAQLFSQAAQGNEKRFGGLEDGIAELRQELREFRDSQSQLLKWMIGLWMTTTVGLLAVLATLISQG